MRRFSGLGGSLYVHGAQFAFTGTPLDDCGDGFTWKAADPTMLCWTSLVAVEVYDDGKWTQVVPEAIRLDVAEVDLPRCFTGLHLRAHGVALPTTLLAQGKNWTMEQAVAEGWSLDGPATAAGTTKAFIDVDAWDWSVKTVMAVLPSPPSGAFVGFGEVEPLAHGVMVYFDNRGVTYAHG